MAEKQAIRRAKVRAFVLAAQGNLRAEMLAEIFLKALPKIRRTTKDNKPPFVAKISRSRMLRSSNSELIGMLTTTFEALSLATP
ncbi:MAG TPA: hypothetical protein VGH06_05025 [Candidatus Udaeobacter sp.]